MKGMLDVAFIGRPVDGFIGMLLVIMALLTLWPFAFAVGGPGYPA